MVVWCTQNAPRWQQFLVAPAMSALVMKLDDLLREIGEFGPYQKKVLLLSLLPAVLAGAEGLSVIFTFFIPRYRCAIPGIDNDTYLPKDDAQAALRNLSIPYNGDTWDACHVYQDVPFAHDVNRTDNVTFFANRSKVPCSRWVFDKSTFESTIATDFDIACERSMLRAHSTVIAELGALFGMLVTGLLADRFGRKLIFLLSSALLFSAGIGIAFVRSVAALNVCRFIIGSAKQCTFILMLVLGVEVVGPSKRTLAGMVIEIFWSIGTFYLCFLAYFIRNWRYLEIAVSVPGVFLLSYWWLLQESPRWLMSRDETAKAMAVFKKIADANKTQMPPISDAKDLLQQEMQLSVWRALRSRELRKRMLIVFSNVLVNVIVYYGVTLNITNLSGDIFINFTISFVLECLAIVLAIVSLYRVDRKVVYVTCIVMSGVCCTGSILPALLNAPSWVIVALSMAVRFFVIISFCVIYLYGSELFPTVVRSSAIGTCISFARVGNLLSPYLADLRLLVGGRFRDALPLVVVGLPAILVGLMSLWLPETRNATLPETLEDIERLPRKRPTKSGTNPETNTDVSDLEDVFSGSKSDDVSSHVPAC